MKDFIFEVGKDFTFIDEEYRVQVGGEDFRIDLLFFHRGLQCLVAFELKIGKFKPEYISKMDFYLEALDRKKKKENENPSVGMILCASKDDEVVEYAMSRTLSPMMVAEYKLQLPDKAVLQKKLQELINMPLIEEQRIVRWCEFKLSTIFMTVKIMPENMANIATKNSENAIKIIGIKFL